MASIRLLRDRSLTVAMLLAIVTTLLPATGLFGLPAQAGSGDHAAACDDGSGATSDATVTDDQDAQGTGEDDQAGASTPAAPEDCDDELDADRAAGGDEGDQVEEQPTSTDQQPTIATSPAPLQSEQQSEQQEVQQQDPRRQVAEQQQSEVTPPVTLNLTYNRDCEPDPAYTWRIYPKASSDGTDGQVVDVELLDAPGDWAFQIELGPTTDAGRRAYDVVDVTTTGAAPADVFVRNGELWVEDDDKPAASNPTAKLRWADGQVTKAAGPDLTAGSDPSKCGEPAVADVSITKGSDADRDDTVTADETAPAPGADVEFEVVVTNTGDLPGTVRVRDAFDEVTVDLLGGDADIAHCTLDGSPFGAGDRLDPDASVRCAFTLLSYAPAAGTARANTATVELVVDGSTAASATADATVRSPETPTVPECREYSIWELRMAIGRNNGGPSTVDGDTATVYGIPADACPFPVNFSSYNLPGGFIRPFAEQVLVDNVTATFAGTEFQTVDTLGNGDTLEVALPPCAWQTDLYLGDNVLGDEPGEQAAPHTRENPAVDVEIQVAYDYEEVGDLSDCALEDVTLTLAPCLVPDTEDGSTTGLDSAGTLTNPNAVAIEVTFTGTSVESVNGVDTSGSGVRTVIVPPGESSLVFSNSDVGEVIEVRIGDEVVDSAVITDDCDRDVEVDKSNDADRDGEFGDDETAPAAASDVDFTLVVTNTGELPGTVGLVDVFDSTSVTLFGDDADVATTCQLDGADFGPDDLLAPGQTILCTFTLTGYSPAAGEQLDNVVTATLTPTRGEQAVDEDGSTVRSPAAEEPEPAAVEVDKTNDADVDGEFGDREVAPAPGEDVTFRVVVDNPGPVAGQVRLYDTLDDGTELFLFGLDPSATTDVDTSCVDGTGAPFGPRDVLGVGDSITCTFALAEYSPPFLDQRDNVVRAELVSYELDGEDVVGVDVLAQDEDGSTVLSQSVADVTDEPSPSPSDTPSDTPDDAPGTSTPVGGDGGPGAPALASTGATTPTLLALAMGLLTLGVALLLRDRRRPTA